MNIIWSREELLSTGPLKMTFETKQWFSFKKMHMEIQSAKWGPFLFRHDGLEGDHIDIMAVVIMIDSWTNLIQESHTDVPIHTICWVIMACSNRMEVLPASWLQTILCWIIWRYDMIFHFNSIFYIKIIKAVEIYPTEVTPTCLGYMDGLVQDCSNFSALAMALLQSWAKPLIKSVSCILMLRYHSHVVAWCNC